MNHFRKQEIAFEFQGVWGVTNIQQNGNPFEVGIISIEYK
jgi:multiple sugar transport system substrate-binding protein